MNKRKLFPTWEMEITPQTMKELHKIVAIMQELNLKAVKR